jgi:hypothetical protein
MTKKIRELNRAELQRQLARAESILACLSSPYPDQQEMRSRGQQQQLVDKLRSALAKLDA